MMRYLLVLLLLAQTARAAPVVTSVTGTIAPDSTITITGTGFGAKSPAPPMLWDTVENQSAYAGLEHGETIPTGEGYPWKANGNCPGDSSCNKIKYWTDSLRVAGRPQYHGRMKAVLEGWDSGINTGSENFYISWWVKYSGPTIISWRDDVVCKMLRVWSDWDCDPSSHCDGNFWFSPHGGGMTFLIPPDSVGVGDNNWNADPPGHPGKWEHVEFLADNDARMYSGTGRLAYWFNGLLVHRESSCFARTPFNFLQIIGMHSTDYDPQTGLYMDLGDIYVDSTLARVAIANSSTWAGIPDSTRMNHFELQPPLTWSTTSITATCNRGSFIAGQKVYAYVVNADSTVNSSGKQIYFAVPSGPDIYPPTYVTDLSVTDETQSTAILSWTAPGDDGDVGTAAVYDIRYSTAPITETNWGTASQQTGELTPHVAGTTETFTARGLIPGTPYYFAIKTSDEIPNESALSNNATTTTDNPTLIEITSVPWQCDEPGGVYYLTEDLVWIRDAVGGADAIHVYADDITILGNHHTITSPAVTASTHQAIEVSAGVSGLTIRDLSVKLSGTVAGVCFLTPSGGTEDLLIDGCRFLSEGGNSEINGSGSIINSAFWSATSYGLRVRNVTADSTMSIIGCDLIGADRGLSASPAGTAQMVLQNDLFWRTAGTNVCLDLNLNPSWFGLTIDDCHYRYLGGSVASYHGHTYTPVDIGTLDPNYTVGNPNIVSGTPSLNADFNPSGAPLQNAGTTSYSSHQGSFYDADGSARLSGTAVDKGGFETDEGEASTGCCSKSDSCYSVNVATCTNGGGWNSGTDCDPNPCIGTQPVGACCWIDGICTETTEADCPTGDWTVSVPCDPNPCTQPLGACCYLDGSCTYVVEADCAGTSWDPGSTCTPNPCAQPPGACCYPDGHCVQTSQADCPTGVWTHYPQTNQCLPNPCPQPSGACCYPNGDCAYITEAACIGGVWTEGRLCVPNPCVAESRTFTVHTTPDPGDDHDFASIAEAMEACDTDTSGIPDSILVYSGTYSDAASTEITWKPGVVCLSISGAASTIIENAIVSGKRFASFPDQAWTVPTVIDGFTFRGFRAVKSSAYNGGALYIPASSVVRSHRIIVRDCTFDADSAGYHRIGDGNYSGRGGAVYVSGVRNHLELRNNTFTDCAVGYWAADVNGYGGGAIWSESANVLIDSCAVGTNGHGCSVSGTGGTGGWKSFGGGVYLLNGQNSITNTTIEDCSAKFAGGLYFWNNSGSPSMLFRDNTVRDCHATHWGGGVWLEHGTYWRISSSTFDSCEADSVAGYGGGFMSHATAVQVDSCTFISNRAAYGGAICAGGSGIGASNPGPVQNWGIAWSEFRANAADSVGAAVYVPTITTGPEALTVTQSTFEDNDGGNGGTIHAPASPTGHNTLDIGNTIISGSSAYGIVSEDSSAVATLECLDLYDNGTADVLPSDLATCASCLNVDPVYCSATDLQLDGTSSLYDAPNGCGQIGRYGCGCGVCEEIIGIDLYVAAVSPTSGNAMQRFEATATIGNRGTVAAAASKTSFSLDGVTYCFRIGTPAIPSGGTAIVSCPIGYLHMGARAIRVCADSDGELIEADEGNNCTTGVSTIVCCP